MRLRVALNGTDTNPYHALGLTQNPIPQLAKRETDRYCLHLQRLGGDPIPNTDYIRRHLKGWSSEFVEVCVNQFRKGEYVIFDVTWPDNPQRAKDDDDVGSD